MVDFKIKNVILDQFKGATHAEYEFGDRVYITGENGSGKTTIADAVIGVFTDKDYSLKANPEVHNIFAEESEPSVTVVADIDETEVSFRKFQKDSRTKKQKEAGAPVRISNQYEINAVPKSQKDFMAALKEYGVDIDNFLLLSHPEIFTSQKSADCRKILFGMVSDITDKEIADSLPDCTEASELLEKYKPEEITAMKKREKKEASENLDAIPEQIIGMEKSKVDIDVGEFKSQRDTLQNEVNALENQVMEMRIPSIGELNQEIIRLEQEGKTIIATANSERVAKLTEINAIIGDMRIKYKGLERDRERYTQDIQDNMKRVKEYRDRYEELSHQFIEAKSEEFDGTNQKCPQCGQNLPIAQIEQMRIRFEKLKEEKKHSINTEAASVKKRVKTLENEINADNRKLKDCEMALNDLYNEIEDKSKEREQYEKVIDATGSKEYSDVLSKIAEIKHQISNRDELIAQEDKINATLRERKQAIRELDDLIAQAKVNERIDRQIAEAKQKQKEYAQAEAEANKILDQLAKISMKKNEMLTDQVNSHFKLVRFKLFEQQKNGEYKDCCVPTIKNAAGEYMTFGESANTALELQGKLDIISGLQEFYGQHLPVFVDGFECVDSETAKSIQMDTQLITLAVTDDPLTVRSE